jgi:hypothetical protein
MKIASVFKCKKNFRIILVINVFFLIFCNHYIHRIFYSTNTFREDFLVFTANSSLECEKRLDWLELTRDIFIKTNTVKYYTNEKKLLMLFILRTANANVKNFEIFNSCKLNYKNQIYNFKKEHLKIEMFFNIRQYQNYLLTYSCFDFGNSMSINSNLTLTCSNNVRTNIKITHKKKSSDKNAIVCTEPLFLESKDSPSLAWWIELIRLSGYKKLVLFNNSIPNTDKFRRLFSRHGHFLEINQLKCLPNFIKPNESKYLTNYREFISGEWNGNNIHFLSFDGIANNECLYSNAHANKLVLIQDNDEAFLLPRLDKFSTLSKMVEFLSDSTNAYALNKTKYPTRNDCNVKSFSEFIEREIYLRNEINENYSLFFQNILFAKNDLIERIVEKISLIKFHKLKYPLKLNIQEEDDASNRLTNFTLIIKNEHELNYANNILDIHQNLIKPFMEENEKWLKRIPENFKRFFFFKKPLSLPQYGKSLTNLDTATFSDPHKPNGNLFELEEYYMSHFREVTVLERIEVPITSVCFDFNYFYCYFQPIFENFIK